VDDDFTVEEDAVLDVAAPGVLANDTDADVGDSRTAVLASDVSNGTLALGADGSFTYTPNAEFDGTDSFTYFANDGNADSATAATVMITVTPQTNEADLSVLIQPVEGFGEEGQPFTHDILVTNFGPSDVEGAMVSSALDSRLVDVTWACTASGGASCPATGSGDLDELVDIPAGGDLMFTITGTLTEGTPEEITSAVAVTVPATPPDPVPANNADEVTVRTGLFSDGFEASAAPVP